MSPSNDFVPPGPGCMFRYRLQLLLPILTVVALACAAPSRVAAQHPLAEESPARSGWTILRTKPFLPPDFDQDIYDQLWTAWEPSERDRAQKQGLDERRRLIAEHYGLLLDPEAPPGEFQLLGYVPTPQGWSMNCLACHAGRVDGRIIPGLGNNRLALQTLTEDVRQTKLINLRPLSHLDLAILKLPLNTTNGTSNSVMFGVVLGSKRTLDMTVDRSRRVPPLKHHDMDAPAWWNVRRKTRLYADGFAPKTNRAIMQFMLLPDNDRDTVLGWEDDFSRILEWIESIPVPHYAGPVDAGLARRGQAVFTAHCEACHGSSGEAATYPERVVDWDEVQTDPVRLRALTGEHRQWMRDGWISRFGKDRVDMQPQGYVAPPLDGVWATAPYFHNGSAPTLQDVLSPGERPAVWRMSSEVYDHKRMGLTVERLSQAPEGLPNAERRWYFDSTRPGKSAAGHAFAESLDEAERAALLEYLKTL